MKRPLLKIFLLLVFITATSIELLAQPVINYPGNTTPNNYTFSVGASVGTLTPTNTGTVPVGSYGAVTTWSTLPTGYYPYGIATDNAGNSYVISYRPTSGQTVARVYQVSATGVLTQLTFAGGNPLSNPTGIAIDGNGNLFISDQQNGFVYKFSISGTTATLIATIGTNTTGNIYSPQGIAFDSANNLYVADIQGGGATAGIIFKIASGSTTVTSYSTGYNNPLGVAVDLSGNLYVSSANTPTTIIKYSGGVKSSITGFTNAKFLNSDGLGNIYVSDATAKNIYRISAAGAVTSMISTGLTAPYQVAFDGSLNIYIADYSSTKILKSVPTYYTYTGTLPAGLVFNKITGAITGSPTTATVTSIIVTAASTSGNSAPVTVTFNITAASRPTLTYNPSSYTITYGGAVNAAIVNTGGTVTSAYAITSGSLPSGLSLNTTTGAITGVPNVTATTTVSVNASNSSGSSVTPATLTITVNPALLTVTATGPAKPYGTTITAGPSATNFTASGTVSGQAVTSVTLTPDAAGASSTTPVGTPYTITPSAATGSGGFLASNYSISYVPYAGTVSKGNLNITANNVSKVYGQVLTGGSGSTAFTATGLANGETVGSVTIAYGAAGGATASVGTYTTQVTPSAATGGTFNPNNYNITYTSGSIAVTGASLTVTATGPTKTYGTALTTGTSTTNFTYSATVNGETVTGVTLTPNAAGASANTAAGASYTVTPSIATGSGGFAAGNYIITYMPYTGTVAQAPLTVMATGPTKTYGTALTTGTSTTNFTATGTISGQTVTSVTLTPNAAGASTSTPAGSSYTVTPSAATGSGGFNANNYSITYVPYNGTVAQAILNISADNQVKIVGDPNPPLTVTYTGFVNGDTQASLTTQPTITTTATTASPVGTYPITASGASSPNYSINYSDGILTVNPMKPNISYANPAPYMVGTTISPLSPTNMGGPVGTSGSYSPSLILKAANGLNNPYGMAVDPTGNVYVTNYSANTVTEYTTTGTVSTFNVGSKPVGIIFDAGGDAYVLQQGTSSIVEYAGGMSGASSTIVTGLNTPTGIAIDATGYLYVANTTGNGGRGTVTKYAGTGGAAVLTINPPNSLFGSGYVGAVNAGIAVDAAGNIYVVDNNLLDINTFYAGPSVDVYSPSGAYTGNYENGTNYSAISIDKNGNIYLTDNGAKTAAVYTANFATTIVNETGFSNPEGITSDAFGNFYVSDYNNNTVTKYAPTKGYVLTGILSAGLGFNTNTGTFTGTPQVPFPATTYTVTAYNISGSSSTTVTLSCVANPPVIAYNPSTESYPVNQPITPLYPTVTGSALYPNQYNTTPTPFETALSPWGMTYANGKIYVTNSGNNTVSVYNTSGGSAILTFSVANKPTGIAADASGNIYVIFSNGRVTSYNSGGTGATVVTNAIYNATGGGTYANGIAIDASGNLFMSDYQNGYIWEYNASAGTTSVIARGMNGPTGIQVDASGNIYIVELNGKTLKKFSSAGILKATVLSGFSSPYSLYVDPAGNYYIGGSVAAGAVSEYSSSGAFIQTITTTLGSPRGIVVDGSGNLYVSDFSNNKVIEYTPTYYTISPSITTGSPGLSFDPITGKFTGTPTAPSGPTTYTITAYGFGHVPVTTTETITCYTSYDWVGTQTGGLWSTAANWQSGVVPGSTNTANIGVNVAFTYPPVVSASTSVGAVVMGNKGGQASSVSINSGVTLAVNGDITKQSDANSVAAYSTSALLGTGGTIAAVNVNELANTSTATGTYTDGINSSITNLNLSGNINLTSTYGTYAANALFTVSGGTVSLSGTGTNTGIVNTTNQTGSTSTIGMTGGVLQFLNATPLSGLSATGTNTLALTGGAIDYHGAAQTVYTDAAITGLSTGVSYYGLTFSGTGIKTPNGGTTNNLNVAGNYTNSLANNSTSYVPLTSTVVNFNGTAAQALAGGAASSTYGSVFNTVNFSNAGVKTMSGAFYVQSTGTLSMNSGATLIAGDNMTSSQTTANAFLTLLSDVNGAANIAAIPSGCAITGNVNVQRYITGGTSTYRGYRMLSSPVSTSGSSGIVNINYLINQVYLTGTSGTGGGFDGGSNPSLYLFRENLLPNNSTFTGGNFRGVNNITAAPTYTIDVDGAGYNIPTGNGYQMFYRGDRKAAAYSAETTTSYVPTADTLTATGFLNQGAITVKNWYDNTKSLLYSTTSQSTNIEGYNLLGNPYASSINFDTYSTSNSAAGIYAPGTNPYMYILDPVSKNYNVYQAGNGGAGTLAATGSNIIPSGQGFFIVANTASAQLTFNEAAKINAQATTANGDLFLALQQNSILQQKSFLRLELNKDTINRDAVFINFNTTANANYSGSEDAPYKVGHGYVSLASRSADGISLAINTTPYPKKTQPIPLNVSAYISGTYTLRMTDRKNMPDMYDIWLKDAYMKDSLDIKHNSTYTFDVNTSDTASYGNNRFSLIIRQDPALSLHLINFTAQKAAGTTVQTAWTVENEANYTKFNLLKSTDGTSFNSIDSLLSTGVSTYSFTDASPKSQNYYRLQLTDLAGNISYSSVIPVSYSSSSRPVNSLTVYPNPTNNLINIAVNQGTIATSGLQNQAVASTAPATGSYDIKITNMTGEVLKSVSAVSANWQNNVSSLLPGTYIIQVFSHGSSSVVGRTTFVKL